MNKSNYLLFGDVNSPHLYKWYVELSKKYKVSVVTLAQSNRFKYENLYQLRNSEKLGRNIPKLLSIFELYKIIKKINPKIVNAHYVTSYGLLASILSFLFSYKLVVSAWGSDILVTPQKNKIYYKLTKFALDRADIITSDSTHMSNEIALMSNTNVVTFPMGIKKSTIKTNTRKSKKYTFLSLRALVENSNVDIIIDAFYLLYLKNRDVELVIANTGDCVSFLTDKVIQLGIQGSVKFVGLLDERALDKEMSSSHCYITIPTSDALSVSLMEALASEMIIVASDLPANKELLDENNCLFTNIEAESLMEKMEEAMGFNPSKLDFIYNFNRKLLTNKCLWEVNIKQLYTEIDLMNEI